jgi:ABC-type sugar transport system substrate-binding protein
MTFVSKTALAASFLVGIGPSLALADAASELAMSRLGTTDANPVLIEAINRAAKPVTPELRAKALECWTANGCDTGTGGAVTVAYADGFGENVWRRVTAMEFIQQALTYPEIGKIQYTSAGGDAFKAISDIKAYTTQGVDVIVVFADAGEAVLPAIQEATAAGIKVVLHNGTTAGTAGTDYLSNISEDICALGAGFVGAVVEGNPEAKTIVALGGTPGNPLSAAWQACAETEAAKTEGLTVAAKLDTNWTQEGTLTAVTAALSQFDPVDGYIYEYADGFRGAVRAYEAANKPMDFVAALRTDEQGLFCDWEAAANDKFKVYYSSGQNFQSRFALTAAMMAIAGTAVDTQITVPFKLKPAVVGLCNPDLPMETSVSTLVDTETLQGMFPK